MVWMPSMTRNTLRRRQSQSPSSSTDSSHKPNRNFFGSKHKRRLFGRDSSVSEASSLSSRGAVHTDTAAWRVENIRHSAPTPDEWWQSPGLFKNSAGFEEPVNESLEVASAGRSSSTPAIVNGAFHNCGLETWLRVRHEWKQRTVRTMPEKPTPTERSQLIKGLTRSSSLRTYELPRRMALSDLILAYTDIWEGDL